jgi:prolyl-tRNA synthetase
MIRDQRQKLAIGSRYYEAANAILDQLILVWKCDRPVPIGNGQTAVLVDQFADTNKIFKPQAIVRYVLEVRDADGKLTRLRDAKKKKAKAAKAAAKAQPLTGKKRLPKRTKP